MPIGPNFGHQHDVPRPWAFDFADATARLAGTGYIFVVEDEGRWAKQLDDGTLWELTIFSGPTWIQIFNPAVPAGALLASNNLSELTGTAATARSNIGLGTAAVLASDTDVTLAANSDLRLATQKAVKAYIATVVAGLLKFISSTDCSANPNYPAATKGDTYIVSVAGKIGGASGRTVEVGDFYFAIADNAGGTQAGVGASWDVLQVNLIGALLTTDIGVTVQGYDADLAAIAALTATTDNFLQSKSSAWASRTPAQVAADLQGTTSTTLAAGNDSRFTQEPKNAQSGTTYTLVAGDIATCVEITNAAAITLTFPQDSDAVIPIGSVGSIRQKGAGQITFANGTGATIVVQGGKTKTAEQDAPAFWKKDAANTYWITGDVA